jgi:hypothetical protein
MGREKNPPAQIGITDHLITDHLITDHLITDHPTT